MTRFTLRAAAATVLMTAVSMSSAQAQNSSSGDPARFRADGIATQAYNADTDGTAVAPPSGGNSGTVAVAPPAMLRGPALAQVAPGYPYLNAPLYSCPRQDVPYQVGGTVITNQAFAPHEMLYKHEYKAMYPPFYYRAKGGYIWTPFGIHSHEHWQLQGTVVKVKYRTHYGLFSAFHEPVIR